MLALKSLVFIVVLASQGALAEMKVYEDILAKATSAEKADLGKLLQQIRMVPAKDPSGRPVFKVVAVEKGSVYAREGVKVGDLITTRNADSGRGMEFYNSPKATKAKQNP